MRNLSWKRIWGFIWPALVFILATTIMLFPQLKAGVITGSTDTFFHFSRFYDTAMQLQNHNISLFQTNYGFFQSGRIVNALYGPYFAYLNGLILLLAKTWFNYQIFTDYFICLLGAVSMMCLLTYVKVNKLLSVFLSVLYINIGLIPFYINSHTFNGWGQALMPLVVLCGVRMINDHERPINWIQLMVVMSLIIQIHVLSALMAAVLLIPFFIACLWLNQNNKKVWLELGKAFLGTLVLTANVWGAYLTLLPANKLAAPDSFDLRFSGVRLIGYGLYYGLYGTVGSRIMPLIMLLIALQLVLALINFKQDRVNTLATLWGTILLLIASIYFPWGTVQNHFSFTQSLFQFPFRIVAIAYPLLILGIALTIQHNFMQINWLKAAAAILVALVVVENLVATARTTNYFSQHHLVSAQVQQASKSTNLAAMFAYKKFGSQPDYLPISQDYVPKKDKNLFKKTVIKTCNHYQHAVINHDQLKLSWTAQSKKQVTLPITMYAQSQLVLNGQTFKGPKNKIGCPIVAPRKGQNTAVLSFKTPKYFYLLLWLSLLSWLALIFSSIYNHWQRRKKE